MGTYVRSRTIAHALWGLVLCLCFSCSGESRAHRQGGVVEVDFDHAMGKGHKTFLLVKKSLPDQKSYRLLKSLWQERKPSCLQQTSSGGIPKIIHQIWLGPKNPPEFFGTFRATWNQLHPDWEYRLWTDADLRNFSFGLRDLFEQSQNYGEKADILRCEILLRYGGLYVDCDFEALKSFDELVSRYDFFAGIEPPQVGVATDRVMLISNALIGATPHHPILQCWKERIRASWDQAEQECLHPTDKVFVRTFLTFGEAVESEIGRHPRAVVFPCTYFFPIKPLYLKQPPESRSFFRELLIALDIEREKAFSRVYPETMAVHHFATTWQKSPRELHRDMQREIIHLRKNLEELQQEFLEFKAKSVITGIPKEEEAVAGKDHVERKWGTSEVPVYTGST